MFSLPSGLFVTDLWFSISKSKYNIVERLWYTEFSKYFTFYNGERYQLRDIFLTNNLKGNNVRIKFPGLLEKPTQEEYSHTAIPEKFTIHDADMLLQANKLAYEN